MKNYALIFALIFAANFSFAQNGEPASWNKDFASHLSFIDNQGQYDGREWNKFGNVKFAYAQNPFYVFFSDKGLTYRFDKIVKNKRHKEDPKEPKRTNISELIFVEWIGANDNIEVIAENEVSHYYSFELRNSDGSIKNLNHINGFKKITYKNVYDNIDFEYTIHPEGGVKYNVVLHPGANPNDIQLKYSSNTTKVGGENVSFDLNLDGQLEITTSLGDLVEYKPKTYYEHSNGRIASTYTFENNILGFDLGDYNNSKTIIIDPWIVSPTFNTSTAVWEVETDGVGNVYTIGGETPMELWKYNSAGVLQWQYVTPWDTSSVWLGTLATDASGNSYVTSGVVAEMHKVDNGGNFVWQTALSGGLEWNSEWWSITFNCDESKLITGGTWVQGILSFDFYAGIFEIDVTNGNVLSDQTVDYTNIGGFGATPVEVRSISSSKDSKFIFLTHDDVGAINENFGSCPNELPVFQVDNGHNLGYKCENYLPSTQNGGGLKALIANDNFIYTHSGDQIWRRDLTTGALLNTVNLPGGSNTTDLFGNIIVHCSGLDVDDCGNVYAGSTNQVVKFDASLNVISTAPTTFNVYDVSVNSNGEVVACGAQQNNQSTNRNGRIEAINLTACAQYALICCDANFCNPGPICVTDAPFALNPSSPGGTWSGTGVNASGIFDPAVAGVGTTIITYTLPCGANSVPITVSPCANITVCEETNGDLTASDGTGPYSWYEATLNPVSTPILTEQDCIDCPTATPQYVFGFYTGCDQSTCNSVDTVWTLYATGTTTNPPASYPILIVDANGDSLIIDNAGLIAPCTANPCAGVTITMNVTAQTNVTCNGGSDGSATVDATGGTGPYTYSWMPGSLSGPTQTGLTAGTYVIGMIDNNGCTATDSVTITEPPAIVPVASFVSDPSGCGLSDGIIEICGLTPSTSYNALDYDNGTGTVNAGGFTTNGSGCYQITGLAADSYSNFIVTDANGCTGSDAGPITLTDPGGPTPTASLVSNPTGCGSADGIIEICGLTPSTLYDNLDYDNGSGTVNFGSFTTTAGGCFQITGLAADTYSNFVVTLSGCTGSDAGPITLTDPGGPTPTASLVSNPSGCGATDGVIEICGLTPSTLYDNLEYDDGTGTVIVGAFTTNGSGCYQITGLGADSYSNFVVTLSGCTGSDAGPITLTDPGGPTPTASLVSNPSGCGATDGVIEICGLTPSTLYDNLEYDDGTGTVIVGAFTTNGSGCYQITGLGADSYSNFVVTLSGCTGSDAGPITLTEPAAPTPTATLVQNPTGCGVNDGIIEICGLTPSTTYDDLSYDNTSGTVNVGSFTTNASGCYQLTGLAADSYSNFVVTIGGCSGTDPNAIALSSAGGPTVTITSSTNVSCNGGSDGSAVAGVTGGTTPYTFAWTPSGGSSDTATNLSAGTYTVTVTDGAGCVATATVTITEPAAIAIAETITDANCGQFDGSISTVVSGGTGPYTYLWTPGGETTSGISNIGGGSYGVTVTDNNGCTATGNYTVNTVGSIPVTVTPNYASILAGETVQLNASGATSYTWTPTNGLSCSNCPNPIASPSITTTYIVTGTDSSGCIGSDTVTIVVASNCGDIFVPNVIAPESKTSYNESICVFGDCIAELSFKIYNRWGQLVFESETALNIDTESSKSEICWDGTHKGKPVQNGVYVYTVYAMRTDGEIVEMSGNITVVK